MFGSLLSSAIKIATLPLDAANVAQDIAFGGSGSKASRTNQWDCNPLGDLERLRDKVADAAEEIDD
jgi:hypothetical protein